MSIWQILKVVNVDLADLAVFCATNYADFRIKCSALGQFLVEFFHDAIAQDFILSTSFPPGTSPIKSGRFRKNDVGLGTGKGRLEHGPYKLVGIKHLKYNKIVENSSIALSIFLALGFSSIPISIFLGLIQ